MNGEFYDSQKASDLIKDYCKTHDINQADYAAIVDVKPESLSRIKAGKGCSIETLAKIATLSGVPLNALLKDVPDSVRDELVAGGASVPALA